MTVTHPSPPRLAAQLLRSLLSTPDIEAVPGDLLEEYREVRRPTLGQTHADAWYVTQVLSVLWRVVWPGVVAIVALRIASFPLPAGWNPSLIPAPGVSALDALLFLWVGYSCAQRTGRLVTAVVAAGVTSLVGFAMFVVSAAIRTPGLLIAPFQQPFIFVILSVLFFTALGFGVSIGTAGAAVARWLLPPARRARFT